MSPLAWIWLTGLVALIALIGWWFARRQVARQEAVLRRLRPLGPLSMENPEAVTRLVTELRLQLDGLDSNTQIASEYLALLTSLLDMEDQPILIVNRELELQQWNPAAARVLAGNQQPFARGVRLKDAGVHVHLIDALQACIQQQQLLKRELRMGTTHKQVYHATIHPVGAGNQQLYLAVLADDTTLTSFDELRREFVTNVTHELKTPLTNIAGAIETLMDGAADEPQVRRRFLEIIHRNSEQLRALIEDLLVIARSEEATPLEPTETCDYGTIRELVLTDLAATAEAAGVSLSYAPLAAAIPIAMPSSDGYAILKNLVENAIFYNRPAGVVTFTESIRGNTLEVAVSDTGEGIVPADLPRIFERFYRVDKQRSRAQSGTGLGLAIVKNLLERHGGAVRVASVLGTGTTFTVSLPLAIGKNQPTFSTAE